MSSGARPRYPLSSSEVSWFRFGRWFFAVMSAVSTVGLVLTLSDGDWKILVNAGALVVFAFWLCVSTIQLRRHREAIARQP